MSHLYHEFYLKETCSSFQAIAQDNLEVNNLLPSGLVGKEVSVAGWGKTNEGYTQNKKNQLVSKTNTVMHSILKYSLEDISTKIVREGVVG